MSLRTRKTLEVLCFLLSCSMAVILCCVRMSVYVGFVLLLVLALFPGVPTFGWGRKRLEFLQRTQQFRVGSRLMWILFLVVIVLGESFFYLYLGTSREQTVADGKRWVYCLSGTVECDSKLGLRTLPVCTSKNPFPGAAGREVKNRAAGQPAARIYYSASFGGWNRTRSAYCCHTQSSLPR